MSISNYFYKLGHCPDLSIEEYCRVTNSTDYQTCAAGWLLSGNGVNVNRTGALVFGGIVLGSVEKEKSSGEFFEVFEGALAKLQAEVGSKKLGLVLSKKFHSQGLELAKKHGFKKVNIMNKLPNFGSWKSTKTWLVCFEFDKRVYYFGRVLSYSNQEFWATLDKDLPHGDIRQGMMNLKFARSLLNLTNQDKTWDPFCGPGRLVAAGMDLKDEFLTSDISDKSPAEVLSNYQKARKIWDWGQRYLHADIGNGPKLQTLTLDATTLDQIPSDLLPQPETWAIVTEGYLGKNFKETPSKQEIDLELSKLFDIWAKSILSADKLQIPEMIFCLPLYLRSRETGDKWVWPKFEQELIKNTGYKLFTFQNGKPNILYAREQGFVGHLILKLVREDPHPK